MRCTERLHKTFNLLLQRRFGFDIKWKGFVVNKINFVGLRLRSFFFNVLGGFIELLWIVFFTLNLSFNVSSQCMISLRIRVMNVRQNINELSEYFLFG